MTEEQEQVTSTNTGGKEMTGFLGEVLLRKNDQIKADRARIIYEDLEREYDRKVDDLTRDITRKKSQQNREFDFSPNSTIALTLKDEFDPRNIMDEDHTTTLEIREMTIRRNAFARRYNELFGHKYEILKLD